LYDGHSSSFSREKKIRIEGGWTHVDDPVLWVVGVGAADVEPGSVAHGLDDANMIATIVKLKKEKKEKHINDQAKKRNMTNDGR
jgi:hypothetical protein